MPIVCRSLLVALLFALAACAGAEVQEIAPPQTPTIAEYRLQSGDRISVTVYGHPNLSADADIANDGNVELPLIGKVEARGKTTLELHTDITQRIDRDYVINPKVAIVVARYQPFYVLGEINSPGSFEFVSGLTMRKAVAQAGGFTRRAAQGSVQLTRRTEHGQTVRDVSLDTVVFPGDVIEIKRRWF